MKPRVYVIDDENHIIQRVIFLHDPQAALPPDMPAREVAFTPGVEEIRPGTHKIVENTIVPLSGEEQEAEQARKSAGQTRVVTIQNPIASEN